MLKVTISIGQREAVFVTKNDAMVLTPNYEVVHIRDREGNTAKELVIQTEFEHEEGSEFAYVRNQMIVPVKSVEVVAETTPQSLSFEADELNGKLLTIQVFSHMDIEKNEQNKPCFRFKFIKIEEA